MKIYILRYVKKIRTKDKEEEICLEEIIVWSMITRTKEKPKITTMHVALASFGYK